MVAAAQYVVEDFHTDPPQAAPCRPFVYGDFAKLRVAVMAAVVDIRELQPAGTLAIASAANTAALSVTWPAASGASRHAKSRQQKSGSLRDSRSARSRSKSSAQSFRPRLGKLQCRAPQGAVCNGRAKSIDLSRYFISGFLVTSDTVRSKSTAGKQLGEEQPNKVDCARIPGLLATTV